MRRHWFTTPGCGFVDSPTASLPIGPISSQRLRRQCGESWSRGRGKSGVRNEVAICNVLTWTWQLSPWRIPVMICPRWVYTRVQPIGIRNIVDYLISALSTAGSVGEIIEIGSPPDIFVNPDHERTKEFMSSVFHIPIFSDSQEEE